MHLANLCMIQTCSGLKYADGDRDARHLAPLLRLGVLPCGDIYLQKQRGLQDLSSRQRSRQMIAIEKLLSRESGAGMRANQVKRPGNGDVCGLGLRDGFQALLAVMRLLAEKIEKLGRRLPERVQSHEEYCVLLTSHAGRRTRAFAALCESTWWDDDFFKTN